MINFCLSSSLVGPSSLVIFANLSTRSLPGSQAINQCTILELDGEPCCSFRTGEHPRRGEYARNSYDGSKYDKRKTLGKRSYRYVGDGQFPFRIYSLH